MAGHGVVPLAAPESEQDFARVLHSPADDQELLTLVVE
jgi:hypothetical protein